MGKLLRTEYQRYVQSMGILFNGFVDFFIEVSNKHRLAQEAIGEGNNLIHALSTHEKTRQCTIKMAPKITLCCTQCI